jgi:hypothetical protein
MAVNTLYFESYCRGCKEQTAVTAVSIPEGAPEDIILGVFQDRDLDECYNCYLLKADESSGKLIIP